MTLKSKGKSNLAETLGMVCEKVRELESRAEHELHRSEPTVSADMLRKKAELLAELPRRVAPYLYELPEDEREDVEERVEDFAANARRSLEIGSRFFMANLLYDEDHESGNPNNLEALHRKVADLDKNG
jgi:hypothetical protein